MKPLTPATPHAIIMAGLPGSGKSTFAEHFADTFQAPIINVHALKHLYALDDDQAEKVALHFLAEIIKTHRTVLIEGLGHSRNKRSEASRLISKAGYKPLVVWVQTDPMEAKRRATKPYPRGSHLTPEAFDTAAKAFQAPTVTERALVISGKHTYATQLKVVLKQIATTPRPAPEQEKPVAPVRPRARDIMVQ